MGHGQDQNLSLKKRNDNSQAKGCCNQTRAETAERGRDKSRHNEKEEGRFPMKKRLDGGGKARGGPRRQRCHSITSQRGLVQTWDHMLDAAFALNNLSLNAAFHQPAIWA